MQKFRPRDYLRYRFDQLMSKGTVVLVVGLFLFSALLITGTSVLAYMTGIVPKVHNHDATLTEIIWLSLMRTLDGGTMGMDEGGWPYLITMLFITSMGILFISTLTGIVSSGIQNKMLNMRKGHSMVIEKDHVVVLGWSHEIFPVLEELFHANQYDRGFKVVLLAAHDKVDMEDEIQMKLGKKIAKRVICRSGDPMEVSSLNIVNLNNSRAVIILTPEHSSDPDSDVIKTILAITNHPERRQKPYHIVAAVRHARNHSVAKMVGQDEVEIVLTNSLISRLAVQSCRQDGLSILYQDILDFKGNNILFIHEPRFLGQTFKDALFAYHTTCVLGLRRFSGEIELNPPGQSILEKGDELIVLDLDIHHVHLSTQAPHWDELALVPLKEREHLPSKTLILGWNHNTTTVINELDAYVAKDSGVHVVADSVDYERIMKQECGQLQHLLPSFELGDTSDRALLERLLKQDFEYIMTMAYSDSLDMQQADAKTLLTLLHLRDLSHDRTQHLSITSEMLDTRNRQLAQIAQVNDFIVSDKLISLMMAQLAQDKALSSIFEELLSPEGCEIYLKPAEEYVQLQYELNFYTLLHSALRYSEIALGYKIKALENDASKNYGIFLNPNKFERFCLSAGDRIIVLAED